MFCGKGAGVTASSVGIYYEDGLFCCYCKCVVQPELVTGADVYPHRPDLSDLPFWRCLGCGEFVGCHHKTKDRTRPLGCIPTKEIKNARRHIHKILDPLWKSGNLSRKEVYQKISDALGKKYHTAEIRSIEEARDVYRIVKGLAK